PTNAGKAGKKCTV
ncbi:hypothetical protein D047_4933B, partial [Vibrio parahaemolyticus VPTS-2010_2]